MFNPFGIGFSLKKMWGIDRFSKYKATDIFFRIKKTAKSI